MLVDRPLVSRLEASAAGMACGLVAAMRIVDPSSDATVRPFGDGRLVATGPGRYINRALGASLMELSVADLIDLEQFYDQRALLPAIEVSAWAPQSSIAALGDRRYTVAWFRSMFAAPADLRLDGVADMTVIDVDDEIEPPWLEAYALGFAVTDPEARAVSDEFARASRVSSRPFVAVIEGEVAGCGTLDVVDGVGWIGGATTLPQHRGRGVQTTLIGHRARIARELGCDVIAATALPDGASARNLVRLGFQHVQTQAVLVRSRASDPTG